MHQGSEWSLACKKLYFLLFDDKSCSLCLEQYYEYVLLDAEREQNVGVLNKLGNPQHLGFPVLVILDAQGRFVHQQATAELEKDLASEDAANDRLLGISSLVNALDTDPVLWALLHGVL